MKIFKPTIEKYFEALSALGILLFKVFAQALEVDEAIFKSMTQKPASNLRLIKYHARNI